jgi:hypothetical protein
LLYNQASSSLKRKQYDQVILKILQASKRWGVEVKADFLDVRFVNNELVCHPLVRYLNERNNIILIKLKPSTRCFEVGYMIKSLYWSLLHILKKNIYHLLS